MIITTITAPGKMLIEKSFHVSLSTKDCDILYARDHNSAILAHLNKKYAKRCYGGIYILEVVRILKRSPLLISANTCGGYANFDVNFVAKGEVFDTHEIIPKAEITQITEGEMIILRTDSAYIRMKGHPALKGFVKGDHIPVRVESGSGEGVSYAIYHPKMSIQGYPFIPVLRPLSGARHYIWISDSKENGRLLAAIGDKIAAELKLVSGLDKKAYEFVSQVLHPYAKVGNKVKDGKVMSIDTFCKTATSLEKAQVVGRPDTLDGADQSVIVYGADAGDETAYDGISIIMGYLGGVYKHLLAIRQLVESYDVNDRATRNIWREYAKYKF